MRNHLTLGLAALLLSTGLAMAQDTTLTTGHLDAVDADDSGAVTSDEYRGFFQRVFVDLDKDADKLVSWTEAEGAMIREHFDAIDADKDANISPAELDARAQADFTASDRDGDGSLN
jgi:hypothetical protein